MIYGTDTVCPVVGVRYVVHVKRGSTLGSPISMRVDYDIGWHRWKSEWVCIEHDGFPRELAAEWWRKRSNAPVPSKVKDAVRLAECGVLCQTKSIVVRSGTGDKYDRIVGHDLDVKPIWDEPGTDDRDDDLGEDGTVISPDGDILF